jgi:hypothetical protein
MVVDGALPMIFRSQRCGWQFDAMTTALDLFSWWHGCIGSAHQQAMTPAEKYMHVLPVKCHQTRNNRSKYHDNGETFLQY